MNRPALLEALGRLDRGEADTLISIRLDRAGRKGWGLVLLSPALDLADPAGRFTANVLASAAQYERELISARTKEGMAQRKVDGWAGGRPRVLDENVRGRIVAAYTAGRGWTAIARELNRAQVPTARGGAIWYPSTVQAVVKGSAASFAAP